MRRKGWALVVVALGFVTESGAWAAREPVLKQVDLPHSYYWRELYLPQLTTGPSAAAFTPDGASLVYSMAGSLWRQDITGTTAVELTHPSGAYDYQPDVAPDGRSVVFVRYDGRAMELWRLDLASGREEALTTSGAVNVEPRISPDGRRIAWVSTQGTGHFNLFIAELDERGLHDERPLIGERRSTIDRYYYSAFDHAINPSWSPDGTTIYYVGNSEIAWGSGDVWAVDVRDPARRRRIVSEETTWSAHPEPAPRGKRLLYSSYHGRQWHQLWLTTTDGAAPFPLTFGDFDHRNARWSPDGNRIVYVSNEQGNTTLYVQDVSGGARRATVVSERRYRDPHGRLVLDAFDSAGKRMPARVSVLASDGRAYAPHDAWIHADDGFDSAQQATETHYFHCASPCEIDLPAGAASVTVQHGLAHLPWQRSVMVPSDGRVELEARLVGQRLLAEFGEWVSADLHVHMNYGGQYRNTPENLARQARAEALDVVYNLVVNKEERVPDIAYFASDADPAGDPDVTILHAQEYHTSFWGHLGLLHLSSHFLTPDFASYRHTALASPYPHNGVVADLAHEQGALVGYVHPFDWPIVPAREKSLTNQLPADVIAGKVDYLEIVAFSDHKATAEVWYRLLNLGFHLPAGAGTDAMANYASLRGPVGMNRVYLATGGRRDAASVKSALAAGRTFATNGPLLGLALGGARPGDTLRPAGAGRQRYRVALRSPVAIDHLELVLNGKVVERFELAGDRRRFDAEGEIAIDAGGWLLLRAWNDGADPLVLDLYPYATTSPVYLELPGGPPPAPTDAQYFVDWLARTIAEAEARTDYNDADEKRVTLEYLLAAQDAYRKLAAGMPASGE